MAATFCSGPAASAAANPSSAGRRLQNPAPASVLQARWRPRLPAPAFLTRRPNAELRPLRIAAGAGVDPKVRCLVPLLAVCGYMGWSGEVSVEQLARGEFRPFGGTMFDEEQRELGSTALEVWRLHCVSSMFFLCICALRCALFFKGWFRDTLQLEC